MSEKEIDFLKLKVALRRGFTPKQIGELFREYYKKYMVVAKPADSVERNAIFFNSTPEDLDSFISPSK